MSEVVRSGRLSLRRRARQAFNTSAGSALLIFIALNVVFLADLIHDGSEVVVRVGVHALIALFAGWAIALFIVAVPRTWRIDDGKIVVDGPGSLRGVFRVKRVRRTELSSGYYLWLFTLDNGFELEALDQKMSEDDANVLSEGFAEEFGVFIR